MKIVVNARGAARVRGGHPWVYRSDLNAVENVAPGGLSPVCDLAGNILGTALYSTASQIAVRMIADHAVAPDQLRLLLLQRMAAAFDLRQRIVCDSDAYRLVFSEADFLPGLIVDRYNDVISLQVLTQAMDLAPVRELLMKELIGRFSPVALIEHVDARIRVLEQLPDRPSGLLYGTNAKTIFTMNGIRFHYEGINNQKTGAFLDQRENYAAVTELARGDALDVFCYQGGFALHIAQKCERVTGVDSSRPALEIAEQNEVLNGREVEWIEANAFDLLKDYSAAGGRSFDTIVLDPPAFAKNRGSVGAALRGYKELNLRALKMLRPGGLLATCSCSYHVNEADFLEMLAAAALDARRQVRVLERRTQSRDHPTLLAVPETRYLKCVMLLVT